jgi:hypothetical protein
LKNKLLTQIFPNKDNALNITKFIGCLITWILASICTFIFVQYAFVKLIGASGKGQKLQDQCASSIF